MNKRRFLSLIVAIVMCIGLLPTVANANYVYYIDANGVEEACTNYTSISSETTELSTGWYVVDNDVLVNERMIVSGNVNLILVDGNRLRASAGIQVQSGNSLTIYGQLSGTGALTATSVGSGNREAGIGGYALSGTITINGGTITATGGSHGAGIGGGYGSEGTVIINGGTVTATGGDYSAGIGGGGYGAGGTVTINGGTVTAKGGNYGAGIGGGYGSRGAAVTVTGGVIQAYAGNNCPNAIGGGYNITINGSLTVSPVEDGCIYVSAGSSATRAAAITGSPFAVSTDIISSVAGQAYVKMNEQTHSWTYSGSGATLTATCSDGNHTASLTILAPADLTYDGSAKTASLSDTTAWTGYGLTVPEISYTGDTANVTEAGATASITQGGATASLTYRITAGDVTNFVRRLYRLCLDREPDDEGLANHVNNLRSGGSGGQTAWEFVFSNELKSKNLCNEDFVKLLYEAIMGREAEDAGLAAWVNVLETGGKREEVFNGFSQSVEFSNICGDYGINAGGPSQVPEYGTVPSGNCAICGQEAPVTTFVKRLYETCLGREADDTGLKDWTELLLNHTIGGSACADGFFLSNEYGLMQRTNREFVTDLYETYLGRDYDEEGMEDWLAVLSSGQSRDNVRAGFAQSTEFATICRKYGISV